MKWADRAWSIIINGVAAGWREEKRARIVSIIITSLILVCIAIAIGAARLLMVLIKIYDLERAIGIDGGAND
jgi:hypothetical protein